MEVRLYASPRRARYQAASSRPALFLRESPKGLGWFLLLRTSVFFTQAFMLSFL